MATGQCLQIVHLIPVSMLVEEEVNLEGGISPKIDRKPKLEKISPRMRMELCEFQDSAKINGKQQELQHKSSVSSIRT